MSGPNHDTTPEFRVSQCNDVFYLVLMLMLMLVAKEAKEFHLGEFRAGMGALPSSDPYK